MQKRRKLLSLSALVCALLLVFAFALVGCGNEEQTDGTNSGGGLDENYTSVPTEDVGTAPATLSLSQTSASIAYGGTLELRATVGNPVAGTVTWSVAAEGAEAITFEEGDDTDAITTDSATATLTLTGEAVTSTAYNVTATFVASDNAKNTASASCAVTVVASNVTVNVTGTANALYTDGKETEKSATLTATVSGTSGAVIAWSKTDEDNLVTLNNNGDGTATVTLNSGVATVGTVIVTATVTYNDGTNESATASGDFTISVTKYALNNLATVDFETVSGTSVTVDSGYETVAGTLSDAGSVVDGTSVGRSGKVLKVTGDLINNDDDEAFTVNFASAVDVSISDTETLSFSFEYYLTGIIGDWSSLVSVNGGDGMRATFINIVGGAVDEEGEPAVTNFPNDGTTGAGVLSNGGAWDTLAHAQANTWHHIVVQMDKTNGVSFYFNGTLVCTYPYISGTNAEDLVDAAFYWLNQQTNFVFFGDIEFSEGQTTFGDLYVDNLRITKNISAFDLYSAATES